MKKICKNILITIMSIYIVFVSNFNVYAKKIIENLPSDDNKALCNDKAANKKYNPLVNVNHENKTIYVSIEEGVMKVSFYKINYIDNKEVPVILKEDILGINGKNKIEYVYDNSKESLIIDVVFSVNEDDNLCKKMNGNLNYNQNDGIWSSSINEETYIASSRIQLWKDLNNLSMPNSNYDTICKAFREGDWNSYSKLFESVGIDKNDFLKYNPSRIGDNVFKNRLSYCYMRDVESDYKEKEVALMIKNSITGYKITQFTNDGYIKGIPNTSDTIIISHKNNTDLSKKPLVCPAYKNYNNKMIPNDSDTINKYYLYDKDIKGGVYTSTGRTFKCVKECEENISVKYGPPIASKAGLCFEYKVKVESEVNCKTEFVASEPKPSDYRVCNPSPRCINHNREGKAWIGSKAGPNNDFDLCVLKCDNGKYSDKCIDKCYNENYDTKKVNNNLNVYKVLPIKNSDNNKYYKILSSSGISPYRGYELRKAIIEAGTGRYSVSGGSIYWNPGRRYWDRPGRSYAIGSPVDLIHSIQSGHYVATSDGFLRARLGGGLCGAACSWTGCDGARDNGYYHNGIATNFEFLNYDDAIKVYDIDYKAYQEQAVKCRAATKCSTTEAFYTISINNKLNDNNDNDNDNWIKFDTSIKAGGNLQETKLNGDALKDNSIILSRNGCYLDNKFKNTYYMTEWSFPGTWINNKTGKISYNKPSNDNSWHMKKDKFCSNLNSKDVNTEWWIDKVINFNKNITDLANIDEYNIKASVRDFGYFKWDFNIDCFYALNDAYNKEGKYDKKNNNKIDYKIRNVELKDLFPDNKDEISHNEDEIGRTPGFNWSSGATNIKNKEYLITPEPLYLAVQERGNKIYLENNKDKYLDYEIVLTPNGLNKIRKYSKNHDNNYSKYDGQIKINNGIAYYESDLLRNNSNDDDLKINKLGKLGVNNQEGLNEETFTNSYIETLLKEREKYLNNKK